MKHRCLLWAVACFVVMSAAVSGATPLQAQTPPPPATPVESCPPEEEWLHHLARPGDQWATLAAQYGVSEADLRAANPTPLGLLRVGQAVRIPCVPKPPTPAYPTPRATAIPPPSTGGAPETGACTPPVGWRVRYTVLSGDTLSRLAAACRTTSAAIRQANGCRSSDVIYAGEALVLPCRPAPIASATTTQQGPSATPRAPLIQEIPPQPGPLRVTLAPNPAVVGATIRVTIQDAGAREPLTVQVMCRGEIKSVFSVATSGAGVATATFSTAGYPAGRCEVEVARSVVSGGGAALLRLTPADAPAAPTLSPSSPTDSGAAASPTAPGEAPTETTSAPTATATPDASPAATGEAATPSAEQAMSTAPATSTQPSITGAPTDVAPPEETLTATSTASPTATPTAAANAPTSPPLPTAVGADADAPVATPTATSP